MNRSQRRALKRLPTAASPWEIGWVDTPTTIDGVTIDGLLLVAESASGLLRAAGPVVTGGSLWTVLTSAFVDPNAPCAPARPAVVRCSDGALRRRLQRDLRGTDVRLQRVQALPAIDAAQHRMKAEAASLQAPGLTADPPASVEVHGEGRRGRRRHDAVFDRPLDTWPKASETLVTFAEPLLSGIPGDMSQRALEMASTVWNAVVMADFMGDERFLRDVRRALAVEPGPQALVEVLVARKRARFGGDPRILGPVRMRSTAGDRRVFVETRLPPGYRVDQPG